MRRWIFIYSSTERAVFRVNHGLLTHAPSSSVRLMYKCILHWRPQLPSATYPHWQRLVKATTTQTNTKLLVLIISQILLFNCTIRFSSAILSFRDISPLSQIHYIFNDSVNGRIGLEDSHMTADGVWKFRAATLNTHKETDRQKEGRIFNGRHIAYPLSLSHTQTSTQINLLSPTLLSPPS